MLLPLDKVFADNNDGIISTPKPNDYRNGIFDTDNYSINIGNALIDNNPRSSSNQTGNGLTTIFSAEFIYPVDVDGLYMDFSTSDNKKAVIIFNFNNGEKKEFNVLKTGYYNIELKNVKSVIVNSSLTGSGSGIAAFYELDIFGSYEPKEKEPLKDVLNLETKVSSNRVDLSWELPNFDEFKHVNIYRDEVNEIKTLEPAPASYKASTKIFETNGTYFNDLTVKPKTTYEYTLTTTDGKEESEGVTVQATTPKAPLDEVGGVESEKQENGDYLFKWTSPTKGDVQIYVGGKKYKKVPANDGKILIPKGDLKFNAFGDPDVTLQAIDEDGEEGAIISPGGSLDVPFTPSDIIKSGNGLFALIAPFVLLGLSFLLVPRIIKLIRNSNNSASVKSGRTGRAERIRETKETRPSREIREYRRGRTT